MINKTCYPNITSIQLYYENTRAWSRKWKNINPVLSGWKLERINELDYRESGYYWQWPVIPNRRVYNIFRKLLSEIPIDRNPNAERFSWTFIEHTYCEIVRWYSMEYNNDGTKTTTGTWNALQHREEIIQWNKGKGIKQWIYISVNQEKRKVYCGS